MDDWSKLDGLKKKYDKMIEKREKIKKIYGIFSLGAFGGVVHIVPLDDFDFCGACHVAG